MVGGALLAQFFFIRIFTASVLVIKEKESSGLKGGVWNNQMSNSSVSVTLQLAARKRNGCLPLIIKQAGNGALNTPAPRGADNGDFC